MEGIPHSYLGRKINTRHFRAFIYATNGNKKLMNSWDEFERHMATGLWFACLEDAKAVVVEAETPMQPEMPEPAIEEAPRKRAKKDKKVPTEG